MSHHSLAGRIVLLLPFCIGFATSSAGQEPSGTIERARAALVDAVVADPEIRKALGNSNLKKANVHLVNNPDQPLLIVDLGEDGRGAILVAKPLSNRPRLIPGLYSFHFQTYDKTSVTRDGTPVHLKTIPAEVKPLIASFDVDWLCGNWPDNGGVGLNFCETFVACAMHDLFC